LIVALGFGGQIRAQEAKPSASPPSTQNKSQYEEWSDDFTGESLTESKWEKFTFEGGSGGKLEVKTGLCKFAAQANTRRNSHKKFLFRRPFRRRSPIVESRSGVSRTRQPHLDARFRNSDHFVRRFGAQSNRMDADQRRTLEAWSVTDGRGERLDNKKLGTKMKIRCCSSFAKATNSVFI
jgi:hypothetical protein